jgi:preprotein translocase subunit SecG
MIVTRKIIIVNLPKGYLFIIGLLIVALNSYRVFGNNRYKNIEDRFKNESKGARVRNNLLAVTYIVLTILLFVISLVYLNINPIIKNNKI